MVGFSSGDHIGSLCGYSQGPNSITVPAAASAGLGTSTSMWPKQINPLGKSTRTQILSWCRPTVKSEDCDRNLLPSAAAS